MKIKSNLIILTMLLTLCLPINIGNGVFSQPIGSIITFDCLKNRLSVSVGENSTNINGFTLDGKLYESGTSISVEVINDYPYTYNVSTLDGKSESYIIESTDTNNYLLAGPFRPFNILASLIPLYSSDLSYNETKLDLYRRPICIPPFIETNKAIWENLEYYIQLNMDLYTNKYYYGITFDTFMERNDDYITINSRMFGNIESNSTTEDIALDLEYSFICVYENETGILQGLRMYSATSGVFRGQNVKLDIDIHVELAGYDLPYTVVITSGFTWSIVIFAISSIVIIPIIVKKVSGKKH